MENAVNSGEHYSILSSVIWWEISFARIAVFRSYFQSQNPGIEHPQRGLQLPNYM